MWLGELASRGVGSKTIAREVGIARNTVRRYLREPVAAEVQVRPAARCLTDEARTTARELYAGVAGGNAVVVKRLLAERDVAHEILFRRPARDRVSEAIGPTRPQRWAIEQLYQELKTELGFDHFEGRSSPGWQHHVVLTAVAYAFLQRERMRPGTTTALTFPGIRAIVQEIFTALLLAQQPDYFKRIQELQQITLRI